MLQRTWCGSVLWVGLLLLTAVSVGMAQRKVFELELHFLEDVDAEATPEKHLLSWSDSQGVHASSYDDARALREFRAAVTKEPAYQCEHPLRGKITLGDDAYLLALDSTNLDKKGYDLLYFDANRNGDLTDDPVIRGKDRHRLLGMGPGNTDFPVVRLPIRVDGREMNYAFTGEASFYRGSSENRWWASFRITSAVYRTGEIALNGLAHRIVLLDYNSNGRFGDISRQRYDTDGGVWVNEGDMVLVNPNPDDPQLGWGFHVHDRRDRHYLSKWLWLEDRYWEIEVSADGSQITFFDRDVAHGTLTGPEFPWGASIYSPEGFLKIISEGGSPVPVPAGQWKLANYTIDATQAAGTRRRGGLLRRLFGVDSSDDAWERDAVWGRGREETSSVRVEPNTTAHLPFGPPFYPLVHATRFRDEKATLEMQLIGVGGDECTNLNTRGGDRAEPFFAIVDPEGLIVERGKFEYG